MEPLGMPLDAWILLTLSVGLGLGLEIAYIRARRRDGYVAGGKTRDERVRAQRRAQARVTRGDDE